MNKTLEMLCDRLSDEIEDTVKLDKFTAANMELLGMAVDIMKDVKEIEAMDAVGGYSGRRMYGSSYDGEDPGYRRRYSRDDDIMAKYEKLYEEAKTDKEREAIRKIMNEM